MARTTINVPQDLVREINIKRKKDPSLTQNEVLIALARKGVADSQLEQVSNFLESINRLDFASTNLQKRIEKLEKKQDKNLELNQGTLILLRRAVSDLFGDDGLRVLKKSKYDLESIKGS